VLLVALELQVSVELQDYKACLDQQAILALLVQLVLMVLLVQLAFRVQQVHLEILDRLVLVDHWVQQDLLDLLDSLE
jgi:hypothetical protein